MTLPTMTWRRSALGTLGAQTVAGAIAALKALIDAEVIANPSTYQWSVADSSVPNGTLVLKPRSGDSQRVMVFGGQSPNTLAVDGATAATTSLYIGCADSAGVDAPQASYSAGVPFTTGNWLAGGIICTASNLSVNTWTKVEYWEHADGIFIVFRKNTMNASSATNSCVGWGGKMAVSVDGNTGYHISGASVGGLVSAMDTGTAAAVGQPISHGAETALLPRANYYETDTLSIRQCQKMFSARVSGIPAKMRNNGARRYWLPIYMANSNEDRVTIKMRQISWGVPEAHGTTLSDVSGVEAHKIGFRDDQVGDGPWLVNILV